MLEALKDHFITFTAGFAFPTACFVDAVTSDRFYLKDRLCKIGNHHSSSDSADDCMTYGFIVGGLVLPASAFAVSAAGICLIDGLVVTGHNENVVIQQSDADAQAGIRKVREAASAAGLELNHK